ncbi:MAG: hypothetical protein AB7U46_14020 [Paenirhodobacter sp.]|uniref:hypothetical protein n=1 Tax=Paenirhodobacter sp. TaxID=1965326 RepID=UPI003D0E3001
MRLSEIADRLGNLEGREADEIHIRLRNPLFKGLLQGEAGHTRNSPADYPARELIRARLLMAMFDCGLSTAELSEVNSELNTRFGITDPSGETVARTGLDLIADGTLSGQSWVIILRFTREAGQRRLHAAIYEDKVDAKLGNLSVGQLVSTGRSATEFGGTHLMTSVVPASDLIRPLLES